MQPRLNRTLALLMVIVTTMGLLLSVFILFQIWHYYQPISEKVQTGVEQATVFLQTTGDGLEIIDQVVNNVYTSTLILDESANTLAQTIQNSNSFIDAASTFMGEDLINTITNTQSTLDTAQASAVVIDNIMSTLSKVPLIGIKYNPSLPLNVALGEVANSLDPIQGSLKTFQSQLDTTQENMQEFSDQLLILDQNIIAINKNLVSSKDVIDNYREQVNSLILWIDGVKTLLPKWINTIYWIMTIIIVWLILIQISLLLQGINMLIGSHPDSVSPGQAH
jgi:methyl-accepting chemotaxis protein